MQNYQNLPSKARNINHKVWRQKFENLLGKARYSSFVLDTFHIMYLNIPSLGQKFETSKYHKFCPPHIRNVSMFCPPRYLNFFQGFEIWKYSKFCPPHFSFDTPSSGQKKSFYVLSSTILKLFQGFEIWKYHKFCPPHFSFDTPSSGQK